MRQELNECKNDNAKMRTELAENQLMKRELKELKFSDKQQAKAQKEISKLTLKLKDSERRNSDLETKLISMTQKLGKAELEKQSLSSNLKILEKNYEGQKHQHDLDLAELAGCKERLYNVDTKLRMKISELSQARLSEERFELQVNKLITELKSVKEAISNFQPDAENYLSVKSAFKKVLERDQTFCDGFPNEGDSFESLDKDEVCDMICSMLLDSVEAREVHFSDAERCLAKLSEVEARKGSYKQVFKEMTEKLKIQNDLLKNNFDAIKQLKKGESKLRNELNGKTNDLKTMIQKFEDTLKNLKKHEESLTLSRQTISKLTNSNDQMKKDLNLKDSAVIVLKKHREDLERKVEDHAGRSARLSDEVNAKSELIEILESESNELEQKYNHLKTELTIKNTMFASLKSIKNKLDQDLSKALKGKEKCLQKIETLESELKNQENEYRQAIQDMNSKFKLIENQVKFTLQMQISFEKSD